MENAKAYSILRTFSKAELGEFREFITSPLLNKSRNIVVLFDIIRKQHPEFNSRTLRPEALHKRIFRKSTKSVKSVNNLFTKLVRLSEQYLQYQAFRADVPGADRYLLMQFDKRRLESLFLHKMERSMSQMEKLAMNDSLNMQNILAFRIMEMNHYFNYLFPSKQKLFNEKISGTFEAMLISSYLRILRGICKFSVTRYWTVFDKNLLEKINLVRKYISGFIEFADLPLARIFMEFSDVFENEASSNYFRLKHLLFNNESAIGREDYGILMVALLYYCDYINLLNNHCYDSEVVEIVNKMQKIRAWETFGGIHEDIFINILSAGLRLGLYDWADMILKNNIESVIVDRRSEALKFCLANIIFYNGLASAGSAKDTQMGKALGLLAQYKSTDYYGRISFYCLSMKLYFETNQIEQLLYTGDNLEHFLKEHKEMIPSPLYDSFHSFYRHCCKLARLHYSFSIVQINELANEIESEPLCSGKLWLKEQIKNLIVHKFVP